LDGCVAIVTGGARNIGRAIALDLADGGANVTVVARSDMKSIRATVADIEAKHGKALGLQVDVTNETDVRRMVDETLARFGRIDILVNNAAAPPGADRVPVVELPEEAWHVILETNLTGTYLCSKAVAGLMVARGTSGRIINMSSNCGKVGYARLAAYCASKFGVIGFTQALAMELAPHQITVNAICPGSADTDRLDFLGRRPDGSYDEALRAGAIAARSAQIPLQRVATAEDVAELAAFLGSDAAGYVTGQAINLAGGAIMH
jgi:NAD(P)-dependent dehydrogenase (short-subunit alcohol dehydrogenase family)